MPVRLAEMAAIGRDALDSAEVHGPIAELRFHARAGTHDRLAAVVEAEADCCAFLDMDLREDAGGLVLTIGGPDGAESVVGDLVSAFRGQAPVSL
jgi:hypothetical protein